MNGSEYPDHRSPVRRARERARRRLPCPQCSSVHEPVIRRAPYLSPAWRRSPAAYFACADCGMRLEELTGSAAFRESDVTSDRFPDSTGALGAFDLATALEESCGGQAGPPDIDVVLGLLGAGLGGLAPSISARPLDPGYSEGLPGIDFKVNGMPWMLVGLLIGERGRELGLAAAITGMSCYGYIPPARGYAVCLADEHFWFDFDNDPVPARETHAQMVSAKEFMLSEQHWQVRNYRGFPSRVGNLYNASGG